MNSEYCPRAVLRGSCAGVVLMWDILTSDNCKINNLGNSVKIDHNPVSALHDMDLNAGLSSLSQKTSNLCGNKSEFTVCRNTKYDKVTLNK